MRGSIRASACAEGENDVDRAGRRGVTVTAPRVPGVRLTSRARWYTLPMPIYEFICNACATPFEELIRNGTKPVCPSCGTGDVQRLLSSFAVHSSSPNLGGQGASKNCSSCASSSCGTCH